MRLCRRYSLLMPTGSSSSHSPRFGVSRGGVDVVTMLILVNLWVFLHQNQLIREGTIREFIENYSLSVAGLKSGRWWQLITHQFLHGGDFPIGMRLAHLGLNMMVVYTAGKELLCYISQARLLALYFLAGIGGGLAQIVVTPHEPLLGASGAAFGLLVAYTVIRADELIEVIILGYPKRMNATIFGQAIILSNVILGAIAVASPRHIPFVSDIGHFAHLGGCLTGWWFMRWSGYGRKRLSREDLLRQRARNDARLAIKPRDLP